MQISLYKFSLCVFSHVYKAVKNKQKSIIYYNSASKKGVLGTLVKDETDSNVKGKIIHIKNIYFFTSQHRLKSSEG